MRKPTKKITLNKDTLAVLTATDLSKAAGGFDWSRWFCPTRMASGHWYCFTGCNC